MLNPYQIPFVNQIAAFYEHDLDTDIAYIEQINWEMDKRGNLAALGSTVVIWKKHTQN